MSYAAFLIDKYKSKGLLLDSNLLLLYLVGAVDPDLVGGGQYQRFSSFKAQEVVLLRQLISTFNRVVTTAHVLTEVSNLVGSRNDYSRRVLTAFVDTLEIIGEQHLSSYKIARRGEFTYLGLIDSVLAELAGDFLVVSNDGRMVDMLRQSGIEALKWVEVLELEV